MRKFLVATLLAASVLVVPAAAQDYPTGPVTLVVPFPTGGANDYVGRLVATELGDLGQPVVVENVPGASTAIGAQRVAAADPDGHSLLIVTNATMAVNPAIYPELAYDPVGDFTPITLLADIPFVLVVPATLGVDTLEDFIALASERDLFYGSGGIGSIHHLFAELLLDRADLTATHIPYQGTGPATVDLLGGQIDFLMSSLGAVVPHIESGTLKALGVTTAQRVPALAEVPTIDEAGLAGFDAASWMGIVAPANLPDDIRDILVDKVHDVLERPSVQERIEADGLITRMSSPDEFSDFIISELALWGGVIKAAEITLD